MNNKKNVKLLVFLLILILVGVFAFGSFPADDGQGKLRDLSGYTATDDIVLEMREDIVNDTNIVLEVEREEYTATDDIVNDTNMVPEVEREGYTATDDIVDDPGSFIR